MSDPMVNIMGNVWIRRSRYRDWFMGRRPLPGWTAEDDRSFFFGQVTGGMISEDEAVFWLRRHRELQRLENAQASGTDA